MRIPKIFRKVRRDARQPPKQNQQKRALAPSHGTPVPPPPPNEQEHKDNTKDPPSTATSYQIGNANTGVDGYPLAGYHAGKFFIRNRTDYFRLYLGGRIQLDFLNYFGPGVRHTKRKSTLSVRRARIELAGEMMGRWQWALQVEAAPTAFNNASGKEQISAGPAGSDPNADTPSYAPIQTAAYRTRPVLAYVNYRATDMLNVQVGQFNLPFTMENRTSTNHITFMERALPTRAWGAPTVKDIGVRLWGHFKNRSLNWSWAVVQGDGMNKPNADNRATTAMRVYTRPLVASDSFLKQLQMGASLKYGMHNKNDVAYDYPSMSTQSGYRFWKPFYTDSVGTGRHIHIIPSGAQVGVAGELRVPYDRFDLRGELVYLNNNTREGVDGFQRDYTERFGKLKGYAYYVALSYWLLGQPGLTGHPGDSGPARIKLNQPNLGVPSHAVELALKWEQLSANYEGAARRGIPDDKGADGDIRLNVLSLGANYWASKHLRVSANYILNYFPDSAPASEATSSQRAMAPGNQIGKGIDNNTRQSAHTLHELAARVAVAF